MTNTNLDVSKLPSATKFATTGLFGAIGDNQFAVLSQQTATLEAQKQRDFAMACKQWQNDAFYARRDGKPIPPKPAPVTSQIVVRMDLLPDGTTPAPTSYTGPTNGVWIAVIDGPTYGTCPDLPATVPPEPPGLAGLGKPGDTTPTNQQMLEALQIGINEIHADLQLLKVAAGIS
jgi:hypothetical protein